MNRDRLYDAAFAFQALNLWNRLSDDQIFAIQGKDQIYYISFTGMLGEHYSLSAYPGKEGIDSLWKIYQMTNVSENEEMAAFFGKTALFCEFVPKDELYPQSMEMLSPYAKEHGMSMRGKKRLWPQFFQCRPFREMACMDKDEEMNTMVEAFEAACWLYRNPERPIHSLAHLYESDQTLPLLHREGDGWSIEEIPMPAEPDISYPIGHTPNEMYMARVRKLKKAGTWACKLKLYPVPCEADGMDEKVIPWELLAADLDTGKAIQIQMVRDYETRTEVMLDKIMEAMFREKVCPEAFCICDERTYTLLEDWSAEMGIELSMEEEIPVELEELEEYRDAQAYMGAENPLDAVEEMLDMMLLLMDQDRFSNHPQMAEYISMLREMEQHPDVPGFIRSKASEVLEKYEYYQSRQKPKAAGSRKGKGKKKTKSTKSLVISVSLDTGCYRHIQISDQALLEDLSLAILHAFSFDNDHPHAFFMDNQVYSRWDAYYARGVDEEGPATDEVSLREAGMQPGKKFKYLFDFGDDWTFQCKVLRELDESTSEAKIIRTKGEAPDQYPMWDDEDWDEDE